MRVEFGGSPPLTRVLSAVESLIQFITGSLSTATLPVDHLTDDPSSVTAGSVLICVDPLDSSAESARILTSALASPAAALMVKDPERVTLRLQEHPNHPIIVVHDDVDWSTVVTLATRITRFRRGFEEPMEEITRASIVRVVDQVVDQLGGSIIVEDADFQLLAHSRVTGAMDEARRTAVLQRQLPEIYHRAFNAQGALAKLIDSNDVIHVEADPSIGLKARLAVAIHGQGKMLGSIWFAREGKQFQPHDSAVLLSASQHLSKLLTDLLRARHDARVRQDDAVSSLLHGKRLEKAAAVLTEFSGSPLPDTVHVVTVTVRPQSSPRRMTAEQVRLVAETTVRTMRQTAFSTSNDDTISLLVFGCEADRGDCVGASPRPFAEQLVANFAKLNGCALVAVGSHAHSLSGIRRSAEDAALVQVELERMRLPSGGMATIGDVWGAIAVSQFLESIDFTRIAVPYRVRTALTGGDARHLDLITTLVAVLDNWGDIRSTAVQLHVHVNTIRYRLKRVQTTLDLDLSSPDQRLALRLFLDHLTRANR